MGLLVIFLLCFMFSAFFSGSEMAFVSASEFKLRELADSGNHAAKKIVRLKSDPQPFLTSVLIGNNIVNVTATAVLTYVFQTYFGISNEWVVTAVMLPLLIVFGEMVPKDFCRQHGQQVLLQSAYVLDFFWNILRLPAVVILKVLGFLLGKEDLERDKSIFVSEKEFRMLIEESTQTGVVEHHEKQLIDMILDFENIRLSSVMTSLEEAAKLDINGTVGDVKRIARQTNSPMVLIYEEMSSIIVGMVYVFDLLFEEDEHQGLKNYLRSPIFLPDHTSLEKTFLTLQQKRQSFAVVTDLYREVLGVVPIERLLTVSPPSSPRHS